MAEIKLQKRYKYAGDVFQELVEHAGFQPEVAAALLNDIPDADVAPRAEVAKLHEVIFKKEDLMQKIAEERNKYADELEVAKDTNEHLKAEVAREIFEEIEETLNRKIRRIEPEYERLDECFEKLSECGHSQHGYCKGVISTCEDLQDLIDELKNKYAEGQK